MTSLAAVMGELVKAGFPSAQPGFHRLAPTTGKTVTSMTSVTGCSIIVVIVIQVVSFNCWCKSVGVEFKDLSGFSGQVIGSLDHQIWIGGVGDQAGSLDVFLKSLMGCRCVIDCLSINCKGVEDKQEAGRELHRYGCSCFVERGMSRW